MKLLNNINAKDISRTTAKISPFSKSLSQRHSPPFRRYGAILNTSSFQPANQPLSHERGASVTTEHSAPDHSRKPFFHEKTDDVLWRPKFKWQERDERDFVYEEDPPNSHCVTIRDGDFLYRNSPVFDDRFFY